MKEFSTADKREERATPTVDWQNLSGPQLAAFQAALLSAYPQRSSLEQMLLFKMNVRLNHMVGQGNLPTVVYDLLSWATATGRAAEFYASALADIPGNPALKALPAELLRLAAPAQPPTAGSVTAHSRGVAVGGDASGAVIITGDGNQIHLPPGGAPFPGSTESPVSTGRALAIWREKLGYLRQQEAISADPAQKFALKKQIEEAIAKIAELS